MSSEKKIAAWVKRQLGDIPAAVRFVLTHGEDSESRTTLLKAGRGEGDMSERAAAIAASVWESASEHADCYEGKQRYALASFGAEDEEPLATLPIPIGVKSYEHEPGEPNEKGIISQLLRTVQHQHELILTTVASVLSPLREENKDLRERSLNLEARCRESAELWEELQSAKHTRDLEALKAGSLIDLREKVGSEAMKALPFILKALSAKPAAALPAADSKIDPVANYQQKMREVFKLVDRDAIYSCLEPGGKAQLDALLGLGANPKDSDAFKETFRAVWIALPGEVTEAIVGQLGGRLDLAGELTDMLEPAQGVTR